MRNHSLIRTLCAAGIVLLSAFAALADPGSIMTTLPSCGMVNGNVQYQSESDLYIHGGLPNGSYYVRVIVPGGKNGSPDKDLGSSSPNVALQVVNGLWSSPIAGAVLSGNCLQVISVLPGNAFNSTSNAGGEYQVEISTASDFSNGNSKSDNFKMANTPIDPGPSCDTTDATICAGQNTTLSATVFISATTNASVNYNWTDPNGATVGSGTSGGGTVTLSLTAPTLAGAYTLTLTDPNSGKSSECTSQLTINPLPNVGILVDGATTFCQGGSVTLTATGGVSGQYLWSDGETSDSIVVTSSGTFTVSWTDANACSKTSDPVSVVVNPLPNVVITPSGPTTFCQGGSVTLTASGATSYSWSTGSTDDHITVSSSGTYTVTGTDGNGCVNQASVTVTVNPLPNVTIGASGPTTFCQGGSVVLTASGAKSYLWSTGATADHITVTASGTYSVTGTDANGCSNGASTSVTVNPLPHVSITPNGPTTFCQGGSVTLTASGAVSYLWSTGATSSQITVSATGIYSVTGTDANGCSNSASIGVVVNPLPTITITAGGPTTFCAGGSVTLTASGGVSYLWSNGSTSNQITVNSSGTFSVVGTDANGCSNGAGPVTVTVNPNPAVSIAPTGPTTFCAGASVLLTSSVSGDPNGPFSYQWSLNGAPINGATASSYAASAPGTYTVTVTDSSTTQCSSTSNSVVVSNYIVCACDLTQGAWGSSGGAGTIAGIQAATAAHGPMVIGSGTHTFTLPGTYADAQCLVLRMPANATPAVLPSGAASFGTTSEYPACSTTLKTSKGDPYVNNGKFVDVLFGQTVTLWLGINGSSAQPNLAGVHLCGSMTTQKLKGNVVDPASAPYTFTIPSSVLTWLNANGGATVSNLLALADKALGGGSGLPSLSDINVAVSNVNQGFDSCRALISCN